MNIDGDLLYQILILGFFILGPILPAYLLYKIAPDDKILANGNFAGFKINATGATAIFIVLFAALYPQINPVFSSLANYEQGKAKADSAEMQENWKIVLNVQLMADSTHAVDVSDYDKYIKDDSIMAYPKPIYYDNQTQKVVFYMPNEAFSSNGRVDGKLVLRNGFGTIDFMIDKKDEDARQHGIINITKQFVKPVKTLYQSLIKGKEKSVSYYGSDNASDHPPSVPK